MVVSAIVITLCGFASIASHTPWPVLAGTLSSLVYYLWHWHQVPLEPLTPEVVAAARKTESGFGLVALLAVFFN